MTFSPPVVPDHILLRPIGRGAYGEVWLAKNVMGSLRAVKVVWRRQFESDRPYEREFAGIQRYEPVSRSSGGLVHVLHVGRNDAEGYFYYVMELADAAMGSAAKTDPKTQIQSVEAAAGPVPLESGQNYAPRTLRADLKKLGRLPTADCLRMAIDVGSGLAQLHRQGLVHRDVKPGNIIYVGGRAKLADIGLVTAEGEARTFVGTEGYIPPEGPGTPAADLYALGVVLYEASTGFLPARFPDVPKEWVASEGSDDALEFHEVVVKACEGMRQIRYHSIEALQADLALLQSGQSLRRIRALARRYARLRIGGMVGMALLLGAMGAVFFANYRARLAAESHAKEVILRQQVQHSLERAEAAEHLAQQQLYTALLEQALATTRSGALGQRFEALDAIRRAAAISNSAALRGAVLAACALPDLRFDRTLTREPGVTLMELDPRFERVAICKGGGPVEVRSASDQQLSASLPASTNLPAFNARWSGDGRFLAVKRDRNGPGDRADLEVWDVDHARRALLLQDVAYGSSAFHPLRPEFMAGIRDGTVGVWNLESGSQEARFELKGPPLLLRYSPDGQRFVAVCPQDSGSVVSAFDLKDGALRSKHESPDYVSSVDWDPAGRWISIADFSGLISLMDPQTGETRALGRHKAQAAQTLFTSDGEFLFSAGWDQELICWDLRRQACAFTIRLDSFQAQLRSDGRACGLLTENALQLYAFEHPSGTREFISSPGEQLRSAAFSPDGQWLAASTTKELEVWRLANPGAAAVSPDGAEARLFFSKPDELFGSRDDACFGWRPTAPVNSATPPGLALLGIDSALRSNSLCLGPNQIYYTGSGRTCAIGLEGADRSSTHCASTLNGVSAASSDGRWLGIFQPYGRVLHMYCLPALAEVAALTNAASIAKFEFSPSGDEVAVSSFKGVEIWSTATWKPRRILTNFISLCYVADQGVLWLSKDFHTAGLYDRQSLKLLLPLPDGSQPLAVGPGGRFLAVSADGSRLQVLDMDEIKRLLSEFGLAW